ncbi:MAG: 23S rRNA (adenine(2030)-N(6))-methyltransferase RlmJ [Pseudomonadota bacterium]
MNYRHAFHAGNFADIHKHMILLGVLQRLQLKDTPISVLDTHAGAGMYDLGADPAQRTGEWREGIGRIFAEQRAPAPLGALLHAVRAVNAAPLRPRLYPGSPRLIAAQLRPQDRAHLCELEPNTLHDLRQAMHGLPGVAIHARNGWEALGALLPPREAKRGLVLIDPPFEAADELQRLADALIASHARWPQGVLLGWYPIKDRPAADRLLRKLAKAALPNALVCELCIHAPDNQLRLNGSGMVIVNAPWQLDAELREASAWLHPRLQQSADAPWRVEFLQGA